MCIEANRDMSHYEMQQLIWRKVAEFADFAAIEHRLPNNRKADVYYRVWHMEVIIEVKRELRHSIIDDTYIRYRNHCDYLIIATPPNLIFHDVEATACAWQSQAVTEIGIWWVQWEGITQIKGPKALRNKMAAPGHFLTRPTPRSAVIGSPACTADKP